MAEITEQHFHTPETLLRRDGEGSRAADVAQRTSSRITSKQSLHVFVAKKEASTSSRSVDPIQIILQYY